MMSGRVPTYLVLTLAAVSLGGVQMAAALYPTNKCVSTKQKEAGLYCQGVLKAWAKFDKTGDAGKRDTEIQKAVDRLTEKWSDAETKSTDKGADCVETTLTVGDAQATIDAAISGVVTDVNTGLDLGSKTDANCGKKILIAAAVTCKKLLLADAAFVKTLKKADKRDFKQDKARSKFTTLFDRATAQGCGTTATANGLQTDLDGIDTDIVTNTTISPNVDDTQFITISPTGTTTYQKKELTPQCVQGDPYIFFAKRGSVNKLLMYYQGGGACWDELTCSVPTICAHTADQDDNPNNVSSGFADLTNPDNPFRDWNIVFVTYCSCDIHFGDNDKQYSDTLLIHHRGYENAKIVEKWAREHFVAPEVVFVTGSSAGAYGAWFHAPLLESVWPEAHFHVLADAGNGVVTQDFLNNYFSNWNFTANLPKNIKGVKEAFETGDIAQYTEAVAKAFPTTTWAHYSTAYDGSLGGQTGFYNVMLNNNDLVAAATWWTGSCQWNQGMTQQVQEAADALTTTNNYRYYIGTGSRHTMWGSDKVYTDTTGSVPTILDWINATLATSPPATIDPGWTDVQCTNCGLLLPGDPQPNPLQSPFVQVGSDVVVQCTP